MRLPLVFLALCNGAVLAQPIPPALPTTAERQTAPSVTPNPKFPSPPGLSAEQAQGWNVWANSPGVKSIEIIQLDATVFTTPSVTVNINGKSYVLQGRVSRREQQVFEHPRKGGQPSVNPAVVVWQGDNGFVMRYDDGGISGEIYIPVEATGNMKQRYLIQGNPSKGGVIWFVAADRRPQHAPEPTSPAASGVQK